MVHTVKGQIEPEKLGKTMTHEHFFWDGAASAGEDPKDPYLKELKYQKISLENVGRIFYNQTLNLDNLQQTSLAVAIEEAMYFKTAGGGTLVDASNIGLTRNPKALLAISEATGLNIIMGSGYYVGATHPPQIKDMSADEIAEKIIGEFGQGVDGTGIKPGIIGEIGISDQHYERELIVLKAAAKAQKVTGAPLFIHPPARFIAHELLDFVENEGVDLNRVVICHCSSEECYTSYNDSIAKRGAGIQFDQFGLEFPVTTEQWTAWLPRDADRIKAIKRQIDLGNLKKITVSHDIILKTCLVKYGGCGYAHILRDIVPIMKTEGYSEYDLNTILIENPKRLLAF